MGLFVVTKTIQDDPHALDTQKPETAAIGDGNQGKEPGQAGTLKNETEGAEDNEGQGTEEGEARVDAEQDVMEEDDHIEEREDVILMQKGVYRDYEMILQKLLTELENLAKPRAARLYHFLQQMLIDQRRQAPHLRNPTLADRHDRLLALLTAFEADETVVRGDETSWCMDMWQRVQPFLEDAKTPGGARPEDVPGPSSAQPDSIEVIDSQEPVEEGGSKKQVVQLEDGTQRDLTEQEEQELLENELREEIAAEELRKEEQLMWRDFHAAELRTWEDWAASSEDFLRGRKKRARVQVLVQGQGGRIIKQENWLVGLGPGERLSYSVSVVQDEEEMERDPTATSSAAGEAPAPDDAQGEAPGNTAEEEARSTLLVTGEKPPDMWDEAKTSVANVNDFMQTPLATRFYEYWKQGTVTDRLVGQRFGYGVLGRFYSRRLWDQGCFDGMENESDPREIGGNAGAVAEDDSFPATQLETGMEEPGNVVGSVAPEGGSDPAASSTMSTEGPAAASTRPAEAGNSSGVLSGSRQTSLPHWLL